MFPPPERPAGSFDLVVFLPGRYRLTKVDVPDRLATVDEVPSGAVHAPGFGWFLVERIGDVPPPR